MERRYLTPLVAVLLLLLVGAVAAVAYDRSRRDRIADGVTVDGVDLGGKQANEARATLRRELAVPLRRRPVELYRRVPVRTPVYIA